MERGSKRPSTLSLENPSQRGQQGDLSVTILLADREACKLDPPPFLHLFGGASRSRNREARMNLA